MRILNIAVTAVYTDYLSYHENVLPKYHKIIGNDVWVLTSEYVFNKEGEFVRSTGPNEYIDKNGVHVIRLRIKNNHDITYKFKRFFDFYDAIVRIKPDVIFCHLFQFLDTKYIVKYVKKHPNVRLFVDSHADYSNSAHTLLSKFFLHGIIWKSVAHKLLPYSVKFYGVLPARVDFLKERYAIPSNRVELLIMGADDEFVKNYSTTEAKDTIREKLGYKKSDFIIVTGGKIDQWKKQTLLLMDAVNEINDPSIKLLVFGSIVPELKDNVMDRCSDKVKYIGWANAEQSYEYFACGDIACFPGRHSVYWEQVAGQGIPMICKYWEGTTHVDCGGNVIFLQQDSSSEIREAILKSVDEISTMKESAKKCSSLFMYSSIAKKSIEC